MKNFVTISALVFVVCAISTKCASAATNTNINRNSNSNFNEDFISNFLSTIIQLNSRNIEAGASVVGSRKLPATESEATVVATRKLPVVAAAPSQRSLPAEEDEGQEEETEEETAVSDETAPVKQSAAPIEVKQQPMKKSKSDTPKKSTVQMQLLKALIAAKIRQLQ